MRKKHRSTLILICSLFLSWPVALMSQEPKSIEGHWEGMIQLPTMKVEFNIDFKKQDGEWTGDISIPVQNARDLPLVEIALEGRELSFAIQDVPGNPIFTGTVSEDGTTVIGKLSQSGGSYDFSMERGAGIKTKAIKALGGFEDIVNKGLEKLKVPGAAVAVVVEDEVILAEGYGFRDVEKQVPMTADTLMAIGSASKAFTTFAMGALVDAGKLDWEKPVRNFIPWFRLHDPFVSERLTPRDLVTHRSGLPRHDLLWYNNEEISREELVRRLAYLEPTADLRTRFQYNNLMFLTAGYLIEVLTGKTWEESVRDLVLEPLGMERTNFSVLDSQKDENHALPYGKEKGEIEIIPFRPITTIGPAGSINSSVNEMSRWVLVHLNNGKLKGEQILNPQTVQDMHLAHMPTGGTPALAEVTPADYGLGWFVDTYRGHSRYHHGGNIDGFSALVSVFPQDGVGFVVLTNMNGTPLPELLVRHAADLIFEAESKDWIEEAARQMEQGEDAGEKAQEKRETRRVKNTQPAHDLEDYAGVYHHPGYGDLQVSMEEDQLAFSYNNITTPLEHWHYETFNGKKTEDPTFENFKLTFRTDVNGRVAALEARIEATLDPATFSKKTDPRYSNPEFLKKFIGRYQLVTQTLTVDLKGNRLTLTIPGQPEYELVPDLDGEFVLDRVKVVSLKFKTDEEGNATGIEFVQAGAVYDAEKIKE